LLALLCAVVFPIAAAWPIYWLPLRGVRDTSEYSAWYGVFLIFWLAAALPVSVVATFLIRARLRRAKRDVG
jgi:hypothetical protein